MLKSFVAAAAAVVAFVGSDVTAWAGQSNTDAVSEMAFDHMSINVRDFDGAVAWYTEKLGFEVDVAWRVEALNGKRLAYLSLGETVIELVAADEGGAGLLPPDSFADHFARTGYGHLCFVVANVDETLKTLEAGGVPTFVAAETYALDGTPYERRVGFVKDPEGNVIEFAEPLQARKMR